MACSFVFGAPCQIRHWRGAGARPDHPISRHLNPLLRPGLLEIFAAETYSSCWCAREDTTGSSMRESDHPVYRRPGHLIRRLQQIAVAILRYAQVVGRENVIAGTDCGLGGRVHPQIAWAKLEALAKGAELASKELWR